MGLPQEPRRKTPTEGDDEEEEPLDEEEEGEFLRQSHDFEFQYGITERWLFSTTLSADEPLDENFNVSSVEIETAIRDHRARG